MSTASKNFPETPRRFISLFTLATVPTAGSRLNRDLQPAASVNVSDFPSQYKSTPAFSFYTFKGWLKSNAILTNIIHQEWADVSVKQHKVMKGLKERETIVVKHGDMIIRRYVFHRRESPRAGAWIETTLPR